MFYDDFSAKQSKRSADFNYLDPHIYFQINSLFDSVWIYREEKNLNIIKKIMATRNVQSSPLHHMEGRIQHSYKVGALHLQFLKPAWEGLVDWN